MDFDLYPTPSYESLKAAFIGKHLQDVPLPAAVLDKAVVERNCSQMLTACRALEVDFRPHVKTHKTTEITRLQIGESTGPVRIVVSTVTEAEHLLGFLLECKGQGRDVNILYGVPLPPSQIERLAQLGKELGPNSISVLVDHPTQLQSLESFKDIAGFEVGLLIKVDTGYHRAGIAQESSDFTRLLGKIFLSSEPSGCAELCGFYSHAGHSYDGDSESAAMTLLMKEIQGLIEAANSAMRVAENLGSRRSSRRFVLSVGATPTSTSVKNLIEDFNKSQSSRMQQRMDDLHGCIAAANDQHSVELHAGVYPILDMQQLATHASPSASSDKAHQTSTLTDIGLSVIAEVASIYNNRDGSEALIAAGSLALGREPCKSYSGWGIVSEWGILSKKSKGRSGWKVGRISQEHGILTVDESVGSDVPDLEVGQKIRIWPNHACIAGACFGWYLIVDSNLPEERQDEIVDVWIRWRGW